MHTHITPPFDHCGYSFISISHMVMHYICYHFKHCTYNKYAFNSLETGEARNYFIALFIRRFTYFVRIWFWSICNDTNARHHMNFRDRGFFVFTCRHCCGIVIFWSDREKLINEWENLLGKKKLIDFLLIFCLVSWVIEDSAGFNELSSRV